MKGKGMKIRLVKRENLMKASNRANLVKVAVQVNGRTGQYSSHRWKNPNAALNVLKETMKRAGVKPTDELEFKNKKTKKTLSENQLIAEYKESKTTDTLQDFVKKNYVVSKANEKKVPNSEEENKNTKEATSDGNEKKSDESLELEGTEAEVRNAKEIRSRFVEEYQSALKNLDHITEEGKEDNNIRRTVEQFAEGTLKNKSSRFWIDNRDMLSEDQIIDKALKLDTMRQVESECVQNKVSLLESELPNLDKSIKEAEKARAEVLPPAVQDAARMIKLFKKKQIENMLSDDILEFSDSVFKSFTNTDPQFWIEAKQYTEIRQKAGSSKVEAVKDYYDSLGVRTKLLNDLDLDEEQYNRTSATRNEIIARIHNAEKIYRTFRSSGRLPEDEELSRLVRTIDEETLNTVKEILGSRVSISYWSKAREKGVNDVTSLLKYDKANGAEGKGFLNKIKPRKDLQIKDGESYYVKPKQEYKIAKSYNELNKRLSKLKNGSTQSIARAALDMAGIDSMLRISKEKPVKLLSGRLVDGYCLYERPKEGRTNNIQEVAVVDYVDDPQYVYSISVHEAMHGVLANMRYDSKESIATQVNHNFNEGVVELISLSSTKAAYGDDYSSKMPPYRKEVLTTLLRLREHREFSGMGVYEVGKHLGEKAIAKDAEFFKEITDYLNGKKNVGLRGKELAKLASDQKRIERAAMREVDFQNKRLRTSFDLNETQMGDLVEQMKAGLISLEAALRSPRFKDLALVLLYRMLEEDDEEAASALSAFQ